MTSHDAREPDQPCPVVSVVIPVYNGELTVERTLDSVLHQSERAIEVIVVDDGSTDGTRACAQRSGDERVRVIGRANGGLSAARNTGIDHARGQYVYFLDADDWIEPYTLTKLVARAQETNAQVVVCGYTVDHHDSRGQLVTSSRVMPPPAAGFSPLSARMSVDDLERAVGMLGYAWNKLYAADLLLEGGCRFDETVALVEDVVFNASVLPRVAITWEHSAGVHYVQRPGVSLGRQNRPDISRLLGLADEAVQELLSLWPIGVSQRQQALLRIRGNRLAYEIHQRSNRGRLSSAVAATRAFARSPYVRTTRGAVVTAGAGVPLRLRITAAALGPGTSMVPTLAFRYRPWVRKATHRVRALSVVESQARVARKLWVRGRLQQRLRRVRSRPSPLLEVSRPVAVVALAADYGNLGDLAITRAQVRFLAGSLPDHEVVEIPISETLEALSDLKALGPEDVVTLIGGGNTGDMYDDIQFLRQKVVAASRRARVISFPQTIDFSSTAFGQITRRQAARLYRRHGRLLLVARDERSSGLVARQFPRVPAALGPDVVLTEARLSGIDSGPRAGVLAVLRDDQERSIDSPRQLVLETVTGAGLAIETTDTHIHGREWEPEQRERILSEFLARYHAARVVITDRLHGMIFAVITGTPCLALDSKTGKVGHFYRTWLEDVPYVSLFDPAEPDDLRGLLDRLTTITVTEHDVRSLCEHFSQQLTEAVGFAKRTRG
ncbi:glycosyltransferase [Nocardioides sp. CFH 31398]|uniref:glycosyltransferase n=1 Tax=Nocardioides sp. CFH 31398 TaxID=2919579 RepID=UPI001F053334|nr:glycosyltransferase [Nocardioides sp. CFH 31398]MCH1865996.1 glycosyltransferase [Nocardioides sp. CFH 31398]